MRMERRIPRFENGQTDSIVNEKTFIYRNGLRVADFTKFMHIGVKYISLSLLAIENMPLITRLSELMGCYRSPSSLSRLDDAPLEDKPIGRSTYKGYASCIRNLYVFRDALGEESFDFLPGGGEFERLSSKVRAGRAGHTKNIPPLEAMKLLDISLRWVYEFAPRILRLYGDVEKFYAGKLIESRKLDILFSPDHLARMREAYQAYLRDEDERGVLPWGALSKLQELTKFGMVRTGNIANGRFSDSTRRGVKEWLEISDDIDDKELHKLLKDGIRRSNDFWDITWPFTMYEAGRQIGISTSAIKRFLSGESTRIHSGEMKIYEFLVSKGYLAAVDLNEVNQEICYRDSYYIEQAVDEFLKAHPLNQPDQVVGSPFPLASNLNRPGREERVSLYDAIRFGIPVSAMIVIGIFTARRDSEIRSLEVGCVTQDEEGYWLNTHIAKTLRADRKIPTVRVIRDAIDLLEDWGKRGRENGTQKLFSFWTPVGSSIGETKSGVDLRRFARFSLDFDMKHPLQIRQFRRFFAITYMWRYKLGKLPALSDFLCHSGIAMTKEYVTEMVGGEVLREVQIEYSNEVLMGAANGVNAITGPFSRVWDKQLNRIRSFIRSNLEFSDNPEGAHQMFLDMARKSVRLLVPTPGGACASRDLYRDVLRAKCAEPNPIDLGSMIKRPELSSPDKCGSCPFSVSDEDHREYWILAAQEAEIAASSDKTSLIVEKAKNDAIILNRYVKKFFNS